MAQLVRVPVAKPGPLAHPGGGVREVIQVPVRKPRLVQPGLALVLSPFEPGSARDACHRRRVPPAGARPAQPLKPRCDLGVIQVGMVAAGGAVQPNTSVSPPWKSPSTPRTGWRRRNAVVPCRADRPPDMSQRRQADAQPRVTVIVRARGGDGGRTEKRSGPVTMPGLAGLPLNSPPAASACLPGPEAELRYQMVHAGRG